jgi:hypothetical protein
MCYLSWGSMEMSVQLDTAAAFSSGVKNLARSVFFMKGPRTTALRLFVQPQ